MVYINIDMGKQMKNFRKTIYLSIIFLTFLLVGVFSPNFLLKVDAEQSGDGTINNPYLISSIEDFTDRLEENGYSGHYKLMNDLDLSSNQDWTPIGDDDNPFTGVFDGNGKSIKNLQLKNEGKYLGFFGKVENAQIKSLKINANAELSDDTELSRIEVGAIAGRAKNSYIARCQVEFDLTLNDYSDSIHYSIAAGGAVGYGNGLTIKECGIRVKMNITQNVSGVANSHFGGVVGQIDGGEISLTYVAPSDSLVEEIKDKGSINALDGDDADIIINNQTNNAQVTFGGIVGYASGRSLEVFNNIYASIYYTETPTKITAGGVIGRINENVSTRPKVNNIVYSRYLSIPNLAVSNFKGAVGNSEDANFIPNSSNSSITAMPTASFYAEDNWLKIKSWNFEDVWKNESIIQYSNYFFPNLQEFSTYTIKLSTHLNVVMQGENYKSGYINLVFVGADNEDISATEQTFSAGETIKIKASFYSESNNPSRNFQNYYEFTNWVLGDSAVAEAQANSSNGYSVNFANNESILEFVASAKTEGTYGINITGKEVKIKVNLIIENQESEEELFGSIDYIKMGNVIENKTENFEIQGVKYQSGVAIFLEAQDLSTSEYVFAQRWGDSYLENNYAITRKISIELDNSRATTTSKFFPKVEYDADEGLIANIICYFSNNTSTLTLKTTNGGKISVDDGEAFKGTQTQKVVNNRTKRYTAIAEEGFKFIGWEVDGEILSTNTTYEYSINSEKTLVAKFEALSGVAGSSFPTWAIIVIVVGSLLVIGVVIFIIIKIRKNSFRGYRSNYRY